MFLSFRVSPEERDRVHAKARAAGLSTTNWVLKVLAEAGVEAETAPEGALTLPDDPELEAAVEAGLKLEDLTDKAQFIRRAVIRYVDSLERVPEGMRRHLQDRPPVEEIVEIKDGKRTVRRPSTAGPAKKAGAKRGGKKKG